MSAAPNTALAMMMEAADQMYLSTAGAPQSKARRKQQHISDRTFGAANALDWLDDAEDVTSKESGNVSNVTNITNVTSTIRDSVTPDPKVVEEDLHEFYQLVDGGLEDIEKAIKENDSNTERLVKSMEDWHEWEKKRAFREDNKEKQSSSIYGSNSSQSDSSGSSDSASDGSGFDIGGRDPKEKGKGKDTGKSPEKDKPKGKEPHTKPKPKTKPKFSKKNAVGAVATLAATLGVMWWANDNKEDAAERLSELSSSDMPKPNPEPVQPNAASPATPTPTLVETNVDRKPAIDDDKWDAAIAGGYLLSAAKRIPFLGSALTAADTAKNMYDIENDNTLTSKEKDHEMVKSGTQSVSTLAGMASGAALGATLGSVIPGAGTLVGGALGAIGGILGSFLGDKLGESIGEYTADKIVGETEDAVRESEREKRLEELNSQPQRSSIFSWFSSLGQPTAKPRAPAVPSYTASSYAPSMYVPQSKPRGVAGTPVETNTTPVKFNMNDQTEKRIAQYDKYIEQSAAKYGLDPDQIRSVIRAESAGKNWAESKGVGAQGLMQLMPNTARELGVKDSFDPQQNIEGGTKYLARNINSYKKKGFSDGDAFKLALAAYNAGPGWVNGAIRHSGNSKNADEVLKALNDPNLQIRIKGKLTKRSASNRAQSDNYVKKITGNYAHRVESRPDVEPQAVDTEVARVDTARTEESIRAEAQKWRDKAKNEKSERLREVYENQAKSIEFGLDKKPEPIDVAATPTRSPVQEEEVDNGPPAGGWGSREGIIMRAKSWRAKAAKAKSTKLREVMIKTAERLESVAGVTPEGVDIVKSTPKRESTAPDVSASEIASNPPRENTMPEIKARDEMSGTRTPIVKEEAPIVVAQNPTSSSASSTGSKNATDKPQASKAGVKVATTRPPTQAPTSQAPSGLRDIPVMIDEMGVGLINIGYV